MRTSIASVTPSVGIAVVSGLAAASARVAIVCSSPWLSSPASENEEADHRGDCGQHAKSNDSITHAVKPRSSGHTRSARR